jgi:hypothetical protein
MFVGTLAYMQVYQATSTSKCPTLLKSKANITNRHRLSATIVPFMLSKLWLRLYISCTNSTISTKTKDDISSPKATTNLQVNFHQTTKAIKSISNGQVSVPPNLPIETWTKLWVGMDLCSILMLLPVHVDTSVLLPSFSAYTFFNDTFRLTQNGVNIPIT